MKKWMKPLGLMAALVVFCTIASRLLSNNETLIDYAQRHPELAYASPEKSEAPDAAAPENQEQTAKTSPENQGLSAKASPVSDLIEPNSAAQQAGDSDAQNTDEFHTPDANAVIYQEGFFYEGLSDELIHRITGISYPAAVTTTLEISYEDLRYLNVYYWDFDGNQQIGELICNKSIASDLLEIFYELYVNQYQLEKVKLIDDYNGDDDASMLDNNTSCFNYRTIAGTTRLSKHSLGCAIDINPFYNPYVVYAKDGSGNVTITPPGSEQYADRSKNFPYKIDENDLCYKLFTEHGFSWGGSWNSSKDYQHFEKTVQ